MALTEKQQRFVEAYLTNPNATQAAKKAGYSEKTAGSQGQRLLKNVDVAASLARAREERAERTKVNADIVIKELAKVGLSNVRNLAAWDQNGVSWKSSE